MCAIAGFLEAQPEHSAEALAAIARSMADSMSYRGPDDGDVWVDSQAGIAFGHRRLSIVDLSPAGRQPMASGCGRLVVTYNGEIYNAADIRTELESAGHRPAWRGHSDTEVIVESCARWGVEAAVRKFIGMFAFAVWDRRERKLWLVRDRIGIKPLYWGDLGNSIVFASELKALKRYPRWHPQVDISALADFLRYNYVPAPRSIYRGIYKLEPGHLLEVTPGGPTRKVAYWSLEDTVRSGQGARTDLSDIEAADQLEALLGDAVSRRMISDVPLGAFLSGGVDSSSVVATMQKHSSTPVSTFSIGFSEAAYDEARSAREVADHLGTRHTELYVTPEDARAVIPQLPDIFDEPFADSSQIPTLLVSRLTRRHVTVALSGDGGDELFAGYNRHLFAQDTWPRAQKVPAALRRVAAGLIHGLSPQGWTMLSRILPERRRPRLAGDKLYKLADAISNDPDQLYRRLVSHWQDPAMVVRDAGDPDDPSADPAIARMLPDLAERMQYLDMRTYLPDDILVKVDRASMATSLEARVPLLDHRLVEFAWTLPMHMKIRNGQTKWLLRQVLYRHVPPHLIERPKMGFGVPLDSWLRGPLREWADSLLSEDRLHRDGFFLPGPILARWREHLSGRRDHHQSLWSVLMFQAWLDAESGNTAMAA